jgi:hypothetical protein
MENSVLLKIVNDLLNCSELTHFQKSNEFYMNYFITRGSCYKIDYETFKLLVNYDVIEADSGNFETGERHYIINIPNRTRYKIRNIKNLIEKYERMASISRFELIFLEIFNKLKTKEERRIKIKKLKNYEN